MGDATAFTAEELATWLTPRDALTLVSKVFGPEMAEDAIIERLQGGIIRAAAESASWERNDSVSNPRPHILISSSHWVHLSRTESVRKRFWTTGDIRIFIGHDGGTQEYPTTVRYFAVRFDPVGVRTLIPAGWSESSISDANARTAAGDGAAPVNKGGRPLKAFWDDLWVAIFRQIYLGQLTPGKQADIENAMLDWASQNGHELGESSARNAARKLFAALREEG